MAAILRNSAALAIAVSALVGVLAPADASLASAPPPPRWVLHGKYAPAIDPANFVVKINNRYFPLKPGTAFHFRGVRDSTAQTDDMVVTHQVKRVLGVRCTIVRDTVSEHGGPVERTFD